MSKFKSFTLFFVTSALILMCISALFADGVIMPPKGYDKDLKEPRQVALIMHQDGVQNLVITVDWEGSPEELAWVVPVPAMPEVSLAPDELMNEVIEYFHFAQLRHFKENPPKKLGRSLDNSRGVTKQDVDVLKSEEIGPFETVVLKSETGKRLINWLNQNNFKIPNNAEEIFDNYIERGWLFVGMKVKTSEKSKGRVQPIMFKFKSEKVVYPMLITSLNNCMVKLILYLIQQTENKSELGTNYLNHKNAESKQESFNIREGDEEKLKTVNSIISLNLKKRNYQIYRLETLYSPQEIKVVGDLYIDVENNWLSILHGLWDKGHGYDSYYTAPKEHTRAIELYLAAIDALLHPDPDEEIKKYGENKLKAIHKKLSDFKLYEDKEVMGKIFDAMNKRRAQIVKHIKDNVLNINDRIRHDIPEADPRFHFARILKLDELIPAITEKLEKLNPRTESPNRYYWLLDSIGTDKAKDALCTKIAVNLNPGLWLNLMVKYAKEDLLPKNNYYFVLSVTLDIAKYLKDRKELTRNDVEPLDFLLKKLTGQEFGDIYKEIRVKAPYPGPDGKEFSYKAYIIENEVLEKYANWIDKNIEKPENKSE